MNNIDLIKQAVDNAESNKVTSKFKNLLDELKAEQLAEKLVVEHGLIEAKKEDIQEEFDSLEHKEEEEEDFDSDENLVDMNSVSSFWHEIES
jgi:hypothetical protein